MFAEERQHDILERLKERGKVSVNELSERYSVTTATIRTDLKALEERELIVKTHGGAILKSRATFELASDTRRTINEPQKRAIGELAASLVQDNETIILDTGTTALQCAKHLLQRKGLTVVTNDFDVAKALEPADGIEIIFLGGVVKKHYHCTYHLGFSAALSAMHVDKAFVGANSFSLAMGATVADYNLAETKRLMVGRAGTTILMCDSSKLGKTSLAAFATAEQLDYLVTDTRPANAQEYAEAGIEVVAGVGE